jgi:hypothetical protein
MPGTSRAELNRLKFFREVHMDANVVLWGGGKRQSWEKETLMIAATAGIATAVGALVGGKKGAAFGAISGGVTRFLMRMLSW